MDVKNVSFVIPSNRNHNHTIQSIKNIFSQNNYEIIVPTESPLGHARNCGIQKATKDWIVLCDDDIRFSDVFLEFVFELADKNRIIGLEGYYPSPYVIGRFMMFHMTAFNTIGKFASRHHGDETDWCIRAVEHGYEIVRLSRQSVYHIPHDKYKPIPESSNLLWLIKRHPHFVIDMLKLCKTKMLKSSYDEEYL